MNLSICIITKNEEKNIGRCLESFSNLGIELVVVDTGSTDSTKEIVQKYTDNLYSFAWIDDFSAAKNYALEKAGNDMVMFIDSDEYLREIDINALADSIKTSPNKVQRILCCNHYSHNGVRQESHEWISRIFNKKLYHYEGRIHEQIVANNGEKYQAIRSSVVIDHTGYDLDEEQKRKKALRNITLLEKEYEVLCSKHRESTEEACYVLYQLGKSYYTINDYPKAIEYFELATLIDIDPKLEYVSDMIETYGYALIENNQADKAMCLEGVYEEFSRNADFQFLMGLIYMKNALFNEAIEEFKKATTHKEAKCLGVNSYLAYHNIAVIYECTGNKEEAEKYYALAKH